MSTLSAGFKTYKYFLNFLLYIAVSALWLNGTACYVLLHQEFYLGKTVPHVFNLVLSLVFAAALGVGLGAFLIYHLHMVIHNRSTIEDLEKTPSNRWNLGWKKNFMQVFGSNCWLWFLPVPNSIGDGFIFPASPQGFSAAENHSSFHADLV